MKSKREVLETLARTGNCESVKCSDCPYNSDGSCASGDLFPDSLIKAAAELLLKAFPEKAEFDMSRVFTCATADSVKVGMKGHFADTLPDLKSVFSRGNSYPRPLCEIRNEDVNERFVDDSGYNWSLFYLVDSDRRKLED